MKTPDHRFLQIEIGFLLGVIWAVSLLAVPSNWVAKEEGSRNAKEKKSADYALIRGSVFRDDGFSMRGARVSCRRAKDSKPKWETFSGEGGEFAFRLPVGKMQYIITAEMNGFQPASKTVEIANDERQDISIVLSARKP
jgi:Carboxypeptidase regulatory-like domain